MIEGALDDLFAELAEAWLACTMVDALDAASDAPTMM